MNPTLWRTHLELWLVMLTKCLTASKLTYLFIDVCRWWVLWKHRFIYFLISSPINIIIFATNSQISHRLSDVILNNKVSLLWKLESLWNIPFSAFCISLRTHWKWTCWQVCILLSFSTWKLAGCYWRQVAAHMVCSASGATPWESYAPCHIPEIHSLLFLLLHH